MLYVYVGKTDRLIIYRYAMDQMADSETLILSSLAAFKLK